MYIMWCKCNSLFYVCVDITVRFNQSTYNVTENSGVIQLLLVLSGPSSFIVKVRLTDINTDTNTSANSTYDKLLITLLNVIIM